MQKAYKYQRISISNCLERTYESLKKNTPLTVIGTGIGVRKRGWPIIITNQRLTNHENSLKLFRECFITLQQPSEH